MAPFFGELRIYAFTKPPFLFAPPQPLSMQELTDTTHFHHEPFFLFQIDLQTFEAPAMEGLSELAGRGCRYLKDQRLVLDAIA